MLFLNGNGFISTVVTGHVDMLHVSPQGSGEGLPPGAVLVVSLSGDSTAPRQSVVGIGVYEYRCCQHNVFTLKG